MGVWGGCLSAGTLGSVVNEGKTMNVAELSMDQLSMPLPPWALRAGARRDIYFDPQQAGRPGRMHNVVTPYSQPARRHVHEAVKGAKRACLCVCVCVCVSRRSLQLL